MSKINYNDIADKVANDVKSKGSNKSMKVKTLLGLFNYAKRTEEIATTITELLADRNIILNPSIMKLGDTWQITWDDRVYFSVREETHLQVDKPHAVLPLDWNKDSWFDELIKRDLRNEKEVETKFIIPLLTKLNYLENDRFDGMTVDAFHGCKPTRLITDFSLFNASNDLLNNQVLLVVEAKKEERLHKEIELDKAQKQVKSYAIWLSCYFGLVTDGSKIQVLDLFAFKNDFKILFECKREDLKDRFAELYSMISKDALTKYYESKMK